VHGAILDAYLSQSGPLGALGYPIADEGDDPVVGRVSEFQYGSIWWAKVSQSTVIMTTGPVVARPSAGVRFRSFRNSGVGRTGRPLGPIDAFTYIQNAVELEFEIDSDIYATYQNLRPMQWAGPEAIWIAYGTPIPPSWQLQSSSNGSGADAPLAESVFTSPEAIAYYDLPGPNVVKFSDPRCSRAWVVQNFTGWIVGDPIAGGPAERLSEVVSWNSKHNLIDTTWDQASPSWHRLEGCEADQGWADTGRPSP
jgi:hypothetical protein